MSQPPGRNGGPFDPPVRPGSYGPPAASPPPGSYPPPGVGGYPPGAGGLPPKRNVVPVIVAVTVVVLLALGLGTFVLLRNDDKGRAPAAAGTSTSSSSPESAAPATPSIDAEALPGGAQVAEPPTSPGGALFEGSDGVAMAWVQAMADGNWQGAFDLSCPAVQQAATDAAVASTDPPYELGTYFFEQTLGGAGFSEGTLDGVEHSDASGADVAAFTLQLDSGTSFDLQVYVDETLTVCDFR